MNEYRLSLLLLLLILAPTAASGASRTVLGNDGEIFHAVVGTFGELFPEGDRQPANTVLAIEYTAPNRQTQRWLVPKTANAAAEYAPKLIFDRESGVLTVLWQGRRPSGVEFVRLTHFQNGQWTFPQEVYSNDVAPELAVTRDTLTLDLPDGNSFTTERCIAHLVWKEPSEGGGSKLLYSPILLVLGRYIGWHPVFDLSEDHELPWAAFLPHEEIAQPGPAIPEALRRQVNLRPARQGGTLLASFADERRRSILTLAVDVLPLELSLLGDEVQAAILALGQNDETGEIEQGEIVSVFDEMKIELINVGFRIGFPGPASDYLVSGMMRRAAEMQAQDEVLSFESLANDLRKTAIDLSASIIRSNLKVSKVSPSKIIEISFEEAEEQMQSQPAQILDIRMALQVPLPEIGDGPIEIFVGDVHQSSRDEIIVAWLDMENQTVHYVEHLESGWTEPRQLALWSGFDIQDARKLLKRRLR